MDKSENCTTASQVMGAIYLELFLGPMFSGKTKRLTSTLTQYADVDDSVKVLLIVHTKSKERKESKSGGGRGVSSHASDFCLSEKVAVVEALKLSEVDVKNYQVIG